MSKVINVLVTGANGQLGLTLQDLSKTITNINWLFCSSSELDITNKSDVEKTFKNQTIDFCINCAAYTNVEQAETDKDKAFAVNYQGVKNMVDACNDWQTTLIHVSTDYVFDGEKKSAYTEEDKVNPINIYGESKLAGEEYISKNLSKHYILRTSWLYSKYKKNFYITIKNRAQAKQKLTITDSQQGAPTSTKDLAEAISLILTAKKQHFGLYHFCNSGVTNWYEFAKKIISVHDYGEANKLIKAGDYKTKAKRPKNSKLNCLKFEKAFNFKISSWQESLKNVEA